MSIESIIGLAIVAAILAAGVYFAPKGFRTWVLNGLSIALVAVAGILEFAVGFDWTELLGERNGKIAFVVFCIGNIALRAVTTTRAGMPRPEAPETPQDVI